MKNIALPLVLVCSACSNDVVLNDARRAADETARTESDDDPPAAPDDPPPVDDPSAPDDGDDPVDPGDPPDDPGDPGDPGDPDDPGDPADPVDPPPCSYPSAGALNGVGSVMPRLVWADARRPDGSTFSFDLQQFHCEDAAHRALVFILTAEWCGNCPIYLQDVAAQADAIEAAGGLLVFLDLETSSYQAPTNARAHQYVSGYIGEEVGIRVGDGGSDHPGLIYDAAIWSAVPGGFVVEKGGMTVVANQEESYSVLDYVSIVEEVDDDGL
jgi:hypothetical protein